MEEKYNALQLNIKQQNEKISELENNKVAFDIVKKDNDKIKALQASEATLQAKINSLESLTQ